MDQQSVAQPSSLGEARAARAGRDRLPPAPMSSAFIPLLLLAITVVAAMAFQTFQLLRERTQLAAANESLSPQHRAASAIRVSLDTLATGTAKLAAEGNANARTLVEELRQRGVTITPQGATKP